MKLVRNDSIRARSSKGAEIVPHILTAGGRNIRTTIIVDGVPTDVPDYAKVQGIFIGVIVVAVILIVLIGPEQYGAHFERYKAAFEEGAGKDEIAEVILIEANGRQEEEGDNEHEKDKV